MTKLCQYPGCSEEYKHVTSTKMHLCEKHFKLWQFIANVMVFARIDVRNP